MNVYAPAKAPDFRLPQLDTLRALAILMVLGFHSLAHVPVTWVRKMAEPGWAGVDLFFVISGFLIGGILLDQREAVNYYRVFYWRRFYRIVPLYMLLVLPGVLVLAMGWQSHFAGHSLGEGSSNALWFCPFFLQNFAMALALTLPNYLVPTWSVAVEEQFYLVLPGLIRRVDRNQLWKILALAILAAPLLREGLLLAFGPRAGDACYVLLPCRWDALLLGVLAAMAYRETAFRKWLAGHLHWLQLFWWLLAAGSIGLFWHGGRTNPPMAFWGYTVIDAGFALTLLLAVMHPGGWLHRALDQPFFKPIATVSYGLYLLHSPMLAVVETFYHHAHISYETVSWTATGAVFLSVAAAAVAAGVSWKFFESRLIRLGHQHRFQS